jgi:hypothetical protein
VALKYDRNIQSKEQQTVIVKKRFLSIHATLFQSSKNCDGLTNAGTAIQLVDRQSFVDIDSIVYTIVGLTHEKKKARHFKPHPFLRLFASGYLMQHLCYAARFGEC